MTYSCTNSDTTSYTSALALSRKKVLYVLQSQSQAACLIANLQKKTTYRSVPFLSGSDRAKDALQRKATRKATSKVVTETAGWTWLNLTLETSISAFIRPFLYDRGPFSLCSRGLSSLCDRNGKRSRRNFR